ncbi:ScyD/ScyE family protein [Nocardioides daeguensis]|uniref:ScyD/ScyE family protein n=1 Tax=Nocardioides daeguensis TaxID=908359 RepID=A0ABP6WI31_9ACTN|nr:ScyD/ScyE family protein [Nocardioides daeguensis]MBV6727914.1 ScyD/ScyE family protein [Nocardioides daeguensis]MCR1771657.1 ScyD/ScyE family protein [Nocardioides daeguensis]
MGKAAIRIGTAVAAFALAATGAPAVAGATGGASGGESGDGSGGGRAEPRVVAPLDGPRGVDALGRGRTLVTETGGDFSLVVERRHKPARVVPLGNLPTDFPPAIAKGRHGAIFLLTGASGPPPEERSANLRGAAAPAPAATLFKWKRGWPAPKPVVDIGAYQVTDPDPWDQENLPADSNPFGLVALDDGTLLVSDAAGNDLLRVWPRSGKIRTVARLMPRTVPVPAGLPDVPPPMGPLPPAGTAIVSEAVATSVTVGDDGYWYVGELRGFPATPGTSQVWRIKPGTTNATCDPDHPRRGKCKRFADGFTSITDLAAGRKGIYALELSKMSWLAFELGLPGAQEGGLFLIRHRGAKARVRELAAGKLMNPGGVDVSDHVYVVGPLFGPGSLLKLR